MHPSYEIEREYYVKFKDVLEIEDLQRLQDGLMIDGDILRVKKIFPITSVSKHSWYSVTVDQGKNRMIRKLGEAIGHNVQRIKRIRIGNIRLENIKPGEYRSLEQKEIKKLLLKKVGSKKAER